MSDQSDDEFTREEQAFRASFAETEEFEPLDPAQFTPATTPRILWRRAIGGAAAAVVVVAGIGFGLNQLGGRGVPASVAEGAAATAAASVQANDKSEVTSGGVGLPAPEATADFGSAASAWVTTSQAPLARISPATGWLDGRFYLIGGAAPCGPSEDCKSYRDGVAYDPSTDAWTAVAAAPMWLSDTTGIAFEGKLYFTHTTDAMVTTLVVYDPSTDSWATIAAPGRLGGLVVAGDQLIGIGIGTHFGGDATDRIYDPATKTWRDLIADPAFPGNSRDLIAVGDRLLLSTYSIITGATTYATFDLATQTWTPVENVTASGRMIAVGDSVVWLDESAIGGIYHPSDNSWSGLGMSFAQDDVDRWKANGLLEANGTVVGSRMVYYGQLLDPSDDSVVALPDLAAPKATLTGQVAIGSPDGLLVYRVTGTGDNAKVAAYYLPVSP